MGARVEFRSQFADVGAQRTQVSPAILIGNVIQDLCDKTYWCLGSLLYLGRTGDFDGLYCDGRLGLGLGSVLSIARSNKHFIAQQFGIYELVAGRHEWSWGFFFTKPVDGQTFFS